MDAVQLQIALQDARFAPFVASNDAAGALDFGNQDGLSIVNSQLQTVAAIVKAIGPDKTRIVLATMKAAGQVDPLVDGFYIKLCAMGQEFDDPQWQQAIDQMAASANWDQNTITIPLKQMGIKRQTIWQNLGVDLIPTVDDVALAITKIPGLRVHNKLVAAWTSTSNADATGQFTTIEEAIAFFTSAMTS